jgi:hypothetical protein
MDTHGGNFSRVGVSVSRPASFAQLLMGSEDRYRTLVEKFTRPTTANQFVLESKQPFLSGYFTRLAIPTITMKYAIPTIIDGVNNTLFFTVYNIATGASIVSQAIDIPQAFYTVYEMASMINSLISVGNGVTCGVYEAGLKFTAAVNRAVIFVGPETPLFDLSGQAIPGTNTLKLYNVLGIPSTAVEGSSTRVLSRHVFCSPFQSNYTSYIDICSDTLTKYQTVKDNMTRLVSNKSGVIARIYTVPFNQKEYTQDDLFTSADVSGGTSVGVSKIGPYNITTDYNTPKFIKWNPAEYIYDIDIQMYDQYGDFIYWTEAQNTEFDMTILASES